MSSSPVVLKKLPLLMGISPNCTTCRPPPVEVRFRLVEMAASSINLHTCPVQHSKYSSARGVVGTSCNVSDKLSVADAELGLAGTVVAVGKGGVDIMVNLMVNNGKSLPLTALLATNLLWLMLYCMCSAGK